ncbi:hypothetical protein DCK31_13185 [Listeria monocytogenes]|nr:hypothetical protein DCK31_13185 [Listeria monocytogenes]
MYKITGEIKGNLLIDTNSPLALGTPLLAILYAGCKSADPEKKTALLEALDQQAKTYFITIQVGEKKRMISVTKTEYQQVKIGQTISLWQGNCILNIILLHY